MSLPLQASATLVTLIFIPCEEPPKLKAPKITLVNAAAFAFICRMDSTKVFQLACSEMTAKAHSMNSNASVDLTNVPKEYHDFPDIFNKGQASTLNLHRPYDLKLN